jgi:hypothetical protein
VIKAANVDHPDAGFFAGLPLFADQITILARSRHPAYMHLSIAALLAYPPVVMRNTLQLRGAEALTG